VAAIPATDQQGASVTTPAAIVVVALFVHSIWVFAEVAIAIELEAPFAHQAAQENVLS